MAEPGPERCAVDGQMAVEQVLSILGDQAELQGLSGILCLLVLKPYVSYELTGRCEAVAS